MYFSQVIKHLFSSVSSAAVGMGQQSYILLYACATTSACRRTILQSIALVLNLDFYSFFILQVLCYSISTEPSGFSMNSAKGSEGVQGSGLGSQ